jgi:circadian clock protein KaiC
MALEWPSGFGRGEDARLSTGVPGLDAMLGGGIPEASCTLVLGPTGVGKTVSGLKFLGQSEGGPPGLFYGFYETPPNLLRKASNLVPSLAALVEQQTVTLQWQSGAERLLDEVGHELLELVESRGVRRLVVDGLAAFDRLAGDPERFSSFFATLSNELRARKVTAMFTLEVADLVGPIVQAPRHDLTQLADNLILLRFSETDARMHRLVSILKVRDSDFDPTVREFTISPEGIKIQEGYDTAEAILGSLAGSKREGGVAMSSRPRRDRGR